MGISRKYAVAILAAVALATVVNAAAFAYRWLAGTVTVADATAARGVACTGFYSSTAQPGIPLPSAGTNYDALTYGTNRILVVPYIEVCRWEDHDRTYALYEGIMVTIPVTVGSWYIKDLYGFGYRGAATDPKVYVWLVVEEALPSSEFNLTYLVVYKGATKVAELDLRTSGARVGPIELLPGEGLRLDLKLTVISTGEYLFRVGFYVSQNTDEAPW